MQRVCITKGDHYQDGFNAVRQKMPFLPNMPQSWGDGWDACWTALRMQERARVAHEEAEFHMLSVKFSVWSIEAAKDWQALGAEASARARKVLGIE